MARRSGVRSCDSASCLSAGSFGIWAVAPGGTFSGSPAAVARVPGLIEVFVHGMDDRLWMTSYTGTWNGYWAIPGGTLGVGSSPAVTSWSGHKLDVFVIGTDSRLWRAPGNDRPRDYRHRRRPCRTSRRAWSTRT